jgi:ribosomal protein L29
VPIELIQTLVNAVLLLVVAFVGGSLGLRRFEAIERSIAELRADVRADIAELRTELKADLAELRGEQVGMRSDLTVVALAVGARRAEG